MMSRLKIWKRMGGNPVGFNSLSLDGYVPLSTVF